MATVAIRTGAGGATVNNVTFGRHPVKLTRAGVGIRIEGAGEQIEVAVLDTITINGNAYVPADLAALEAKLRDEVFFLVKNPLRLIHSSNVQLSHTGNTTETTVLTFTLPANSIGPNGSLIIKSIISTNNSAGSKTSRVKIGGVTVQQTASTTSLSFGAETGVHNRNSLTAQVMGTVGTTTSNGYGSASGSGVAVIAINTAIDNTVLLTIQLSAGGDNAAFESFQLFAIG